jgi:hypothetical protein
MKWIVRKVTGIIASGVSPTDVDRELLSSLKEWISFKRLQNIWV